MNLPNADQAQVDQKENYGILVVYITSRWGVIKRSFSQFGFTLENWKY